jgi:hypothetical protein
MNITYFHLVSTMAGFENHPGGFAVFNYNMAYMIWAFS